MNEGLNKARETAAKLKAQVDAQAIETKEIQEVALVELNSLRKMANVGMSYVDKGDIRPSQILLVQKSSNLDEMVDLNGNKPSFGQMFDTGSREIMNTFDCYVVFAKKGTWLDKRHPERGNQDQYSMICTLKDGLSIRGMLLRGSARFALNNLFSTAIDQKYPMFVFNIHVETKKLSNNDGEWVVPVFRVGQLETNPAVLGGLMKIAKQFDSKAEEVTLDEEVEVVQKTDNDINERNQSVAEEETSSEPLPWEPGYKATDDDNPL